MYKCKKIYLLGIDIKLCKFVVRTRFESLTQKMDGLRLKKLKTMNL